MNDLVRGRAMDPETGRIKLGWELAAGGLAGGSQVVNSSHYPGLSTPLNILQVFTNPLEIVYAFRLVFFLGSTADLLNAEKSDCKCKEKLPKSKALFRKALSTSSDSWEFWGCTRARQLACFAIFHFRLFISRHIHI